MGTSFLCGDIHCVIGLHWYFVVLCKYRFVSIVYIFKELNLHCHVIDPKVTKLWYMAVQHPKVE